MRWVIQTGIVTIGLFLLGNVFVSSVSAQTTNLVTSGVVYNSDSSANISRTNRTSVRVPVNLINPTQGWIAGRIKMGFASTASLSPDPIIFDMSESDPRDHFMYFDIDDDAFHFSRNNGAGGNIFNGPKEPFAQGDTVTVIFNWTATQLKISVNGKPFVTGANASIPNQAAFYIGSTAVQGSTRQPNSDYYWVAAGTGNLTDANAAAIHAFGNTDKKRSDFPGTATFVWWANNDQYNNDGGVVPTEPPVTSVPTNTPTRPPSTTNTPTTRPNTPQPTIPGSLPGDANGDGRVDGVDFVAWLNHYNQNVSGAVNGDFNNTGKVDGVDFTIWLSNYGRTSGNTNTPTRIPNATNTPTTRPVATNTQPPNATNAPSPTQGPVSGDFPCGKFPNANPGCMNVSYQSWFDNVNAVDPATTDQIMNVNYTPRLLHQHYDCAVPQARANDQNIKQGMKISCYLIRYNSIVPYLSSNSGHYDSCNQGNCYENYSMNLPSCQGNKYEGKECKTENVHNVRSSDMNSATEMRFRPQANFTAMGDARHFISSNWQTDIGYRSSSEFTTRYWMDQCGNYQRTILTNVDKYHTGNQAIPTVHGTITVPFETNGGCGTKFKTFVFLDPSQHVTVAGAQTGTTLMEANGHFKGNLTWDTTRTSNGIHSVLFINMEGTTKYVSAAGVALKYNVQN